MDTIRQYINNANNFIEGQITSILERDAKLRVSPNQYNFFIKIENDIYDTDKQKIKKQIKEDLKETDEISIYLHFPVCKYTCRFCHYTQINDIKSINKWVNLLQKEIRLFLKYYPEIKEKKISSFYIGGGTPTLMSYEQIQQLFDEFKDCKFSNSCEKTIEGTPDTLGDDKIESISNSPINRVSFGIQILDDAKLSYYHRVHSKLQAIQTLKKLIQKSNLNTNVDLIYGFPEQSIESFLWDIKQIVDINNGPSSITLYRLRLRRSGDKETDVMKEYRKYPKKFPTQKEIYKMKFAATELLEDNGYVEGPIGWFHKEDVPPKVYVDRWQKQIPLFGFGWKAYSYSQNVQFQNQRHHKSYQAYINSDQLPIFSGEIFDEEQKIKRNLAFYMKYGKEFKHRPEYLSLIEENFNKTQKSIFQVQEENGRKTISLTKIGEILIEEIIDKYVFHNIHSINSNILREIT